MKKKNSIILTIVIFFVGIILYNPMVCRAWEVENVSVSNVVIRDGRFNSFDFHFEVPSYLAETQSWLGLQSVKFQNSDFTDMGDVYDRGYAGPNAVMNDDDFRFDYGITKFSKNSFSCFGDYSNINETLSDLSIDEDANATYYVYLWTLYGGSFYPDSLLATIEFNNGTIKIVNSSNTEIIDDTFENLEAETVDKIEINNVNFELKVGEKPIFSGEIKANSGRFLLAETFMALTRESRIESNDESASDQDKLVEDYKYYHISEISIKDNVNLKFDENTKVYINGVEQDKENIYVSSDFISVADEKNAITPVGYVAPAYLDKTFEEEQVVAVEKIVLEAIKDKKVKFDTDETKTIVDEALENNSSIAIDLWITESISKSRWSHFFDEDEIDALNKPIGNNDKFAAYYVVAMAVYVDGYHIGFVTELPTPLSITLPFPNGIPTLSDGYQRIWKFMRLHNGEVVELDGKQTDNGISLENDKYSTFALVYEDKKIEEVKDEPTKDDETNQNENVDEYNSQPTKTVEDNNQKNNVNETDVPQTGDNVINYILMLGLSIIGIIGSSLFVVKKKI